MRFLEFVAKHEQLQGEMLAAFIVSKDDEYQVMNSVIGMRLKNPADNPFNEKAFRNFYLSVQSMMMEQGIVITNLTVLGWKQWGDEEPLWETDDPSKDSIGDNEIFGV